MPVAIITGASEGLGEALAHGLALRGWDLVIDARDAVPLAETAGLVSSHGTRVTALPGDVTDAAHRAELVAAARRLGGVDLLVHNADALDAEPLARLEELPLEGLRRALEVNVVAALGLVQEALPLLRTAAAGAVLVVGVDAAVAAGPRWGGYGASKAALDQLAAVLAVEEPGLRVWAVDPGDLPTDLYAAAVPDGDGPRPAPAGVVPAFLRLLDERPASGRYGAPALLEERR
ncbi:SDR family NAD(P)-dependent oxidoreductase [Streptomyces capillispiralis]|uniref:Short-subunit dehydrogenase n=1 Tax=Streptomyces capillispiralis TaxID=68182 RepID=A0A561TMU1_9ACTN|nr:SDR family oxidoreductase [Streptomyces capillispiralis]TWF88448.1 short-subunit dehydrogenase [Streptomyces capillispiralis]GHH94505.1 oxidoreductase [Streptomyces capillispiralis]